MTQGLISEHTGLGMVVIVRVFVMKTGLKGVKRCGLIRRDCVKITGRIILEAVDVMTGGVYLYGALWGVG